MSDKPIQEKRVGFGRPIEYDPAMCEKAIALGKLGKSVTAIANSLDISKQTLYVWMDTYPDFSDAISRARGAAQEWFETKGNDHIVEEQGGPRLNTTWAMFQMKNRFRDNYGDQPQVVINKTDETKIPDEIKDKLAALEEQIRNSSKR